MVHFLKSVLILKMCIRYLGQTMHHFVPISLEEIGMKRVSTDVNFEFVFKSGVSEEKGAEEFPEIVISGGEFIICMLTICG